MERAASIENGPVKLINIKHRSDEVSFRQAVLQGLGQSIVRSTFNVGISPITKEIGGALSRQIEGFIHGQSV